MICAHTFCDIVGPPPEIVMIYGSIFYSTVLLTTSLDAHGMQAAQAAAPEGLLPGYQPTIRKRRKRL